MWSTRPRRMGERHAAHPAVKIALPVTNPVALARASRRALGMSFHHGMWQDPGCGHAYSVVYCTNAASCKFVLPASLPSQHQASHFRNRVVPPFGQAGGGPSCVLRPYGYAIGGRDELDGRSTRAVCRFNIGVGILKASAGEIKELSIEGKKVIKPPPMRPADSQSTSPVYSVLIVVLVAILASQIYMISSRLLGNATRQPGGPGQGGPPHRAVRRPVHLLYRPSWWGRSVSYMPALQV